MSTENYAAIIVEKIEGSTWGADQGRLESKRHFALISAVLKLARIGIVHNDIRKANIIIGIDGRLHIIDFDQASEVGQVRAVIWSFFGIYGDGAKPNIGLVQFYFRMVINMLPKSLRNKMRKMLSRGGSNQLPALEANASPAIRELLCAWKIAQESDASSPGKKLAYYSLEYDGYKFPGERDWAGRWDVLRSTADFSNKRVLELGCNMSLLSAFVSKYEGASAVMGVDHDFRILESAAAIARAFDVEAEHRMVNFDSPNDWEAALAEFSPDIVFALNVYNWVNQKERFLKFLSKFSYVVLEGHDEFSVERGRLIAVGFKSVELVCISERSRPLIICRK